MYKYLACELYSACCGAENIVYSIEEYKLVSCRLMQMPLGSIKGNDYADVIIDIS